MTNTWYLILVYVVRYIISGVIFFFVVSLLEDITIDNAVGTLSFIIFWPIPLVILFVEEMKDILDILGKWIREATKNENE